MLQGKPAPQPDGGQQQEEAQQSAEERRTGDSALVGGTQSLETGRSPGTAAPVERVRREEGELQDTCQVAWRGGDKELIQQNVTGAGEM